MPESPIQIGSISLQGFEVPTSVRFGGRHRLTVHNLSGGRRIVERLGPDDGEISFQGTFSGSNAEARVRAFDDLRLSGEIVWLTWETFRRQVVVRTFIAEYHSPWWIPYTVSCVVAHQAGVLQARTSTSFALVSSDLSNALSAAAGLNLSLATLRTTLLKTDAMTTGTSSQAQAIMAIGTALTAIDRQIAIGSAGVSGPMRPNLQPGSFGQALASMVGSSGLLAAAVNARSYIGRIGINLTGAGD